MMESFLGQYLTMSLLDEITEEIVKFYQNQGYPLVGVNIPAGQDVTNGEVYILIVIAQVGETEVYGEKVVF